MKKSLQGLIPATILALHLTACVGGVDPNEDALTPDGNVNAANTDSEGGDEEFAESNENLSNENVDSLNENFNNNFGNNFGNNENLGNGSNNLTNGNLGAANAGSGNEFVNNAAPEDFLANNGDSAIVGAEGTGEMPADLGAEQNSTQDFGFAGNSATVETNQTVTNNAQLTPDSNQGAIDTSLVETPAPSVATPRGGTVRYISTSGTSAHESPGGQVVRTYEQGDHPLVTAEGEWLRTSDGYYLPSTSTTTRPVSRAKSPKSWR